MKKRQTPQYPPCAHFVTTIVAHNGVATKFLKHYIVIAPTTSKAVSRIQLAEHEEVLEAREASNYQLVMDGAK